MEYSKETKNSAKELIRKVFENSAKERDAYRMAKKTTDSYFAKEIYHKLLSAK
jgi:hypothetical protein